MEVRYETHRLIKELQRGKRLETQAKQEQALPVTQDVRSKPEKQAKQEQAVPATVPQAATAEEVTVPRVPTPRRTTSARMSATGRTSTSQAAKFKRWQRLFCRKSRQN